MKPLVNDMRAAFSLSKGKPVRRELVCPKCARPVDLFRGSLFCSSMDDDVCDWRGERLSELAVKT